MYYEEKPNRKRAKRAKRSAHGAPSEAFAPRRSLFRPRNPQPVPRKRRGCLAGLFRLAFAVVVIAALFVLGSGIWVRMNFFSRGSDALGVSAGVPGGYTHVLLLGADAQEEGNDGRTRTDSIIIASFGNTGDIKLTSVMRDTMINMRDKGEHKANAAYRLGGGELAMYSINSSFGLNITKYAVINFQGIATVIDAMGGIELTITKAERDEINHGLRNAYKKKRVFNGVLMEPLTEYGESIHMSGTHALFYARIRTIDSDFMRAKRQRILLSTMLSRLKRNPNPITLARVFASSLSCIETNLSPADMAALGVRTLNAPSDMDEFRLPPEGAYRQTTEGGIWMIRADFAKSRRQLYEFLAG